MNKMNFKRPDGKGLLKDDLMPIRRKQLSIKVRIYCELVFDTRTENTEIKKIIESKLKDEKNLSKYVLKEIGLPNENQQISENYKLLSLKTQDIETK